MKFINWLESKGISQHWVTLCAIMFPMSPVLAAAEFKAWYTVDQWWRSSSLRENWNMHRGRGVAPASLQDSLIVMEEGGMEEETVVEGCLQDVMDVAAIEIVRGDAIIATDVVMLDASILFEPDGSKATGVNELAGASTKSRLASCCGGLNCSEEGDRVCCCACGLIPNISRQKCVHDHANAGTLTDEVEETHAPSESPQTLQNRKLVLKKKEKKNNKTHTNLTPVLSCKPQSHNASQPHVHRGQKGSGGLLRRLTSSSNTAAFPRCSSTPSAFMSRLSSISASSVPVTNTPRSDEPRAAK